MAEYEIIKNSSGDSYTINTIHLLFEKGTLGPKKINDKTYSTKPIINYKNEILFPELAILKMYKEDNWNGVWIDTFHKKYLDNMPYNKLSNVTLPDNQNSILEKIKALNNNKLSGFWDVFLWKNNKEFMFIESKGIPSNDKIRNTQVVWLESALKILPIESFLIAIWDYK